MRNMEANGVKGNYLSKRGQEISKNNDHWAAINRVLAKPYDAQKTPGAMYARNVSLHIEIPLSDWSLMIESTWALPRAL